LKCEGSYTQRSAVGRGEAALAVILVVIITGAAAYASFAPRSQVPLQCPGVTNPSFAASPIKIGLLTELTSGGEPNGYATRIGAELAVNATNAAGGIDGRSVSLVILDDSTNPETAVHQATVLDQKDGVLAITGPADPGVASAVGAYAEACGVPFVASTVQSALLTPPRSNWTVSAEPDPVQMGAAVAKYVSEVVPAPKIALMTQNAVTQKEMAAGVRWFANTYKNESIVFDQVFSNAQFPWATPAAAARFSGANAVVVAWLPTIGFAESNVIEALLSAGFSPSQIFVVSATNQVSDLGTGGTGIRGATLFDGALGQGNANVTTFVNEVEPFIKGQTTPYIAYCGVCPTEVGANYYYGYLGMEMIINGIKNVLSTGHAITRGDFMSSLKASSVKDVFGNTLSFDTNGSSVGRFYMVAIGASNADSSTYGITVLQNTGFGRGVVPAYQAATKA